MLMVFHFQHLYHLYYYICIYPWDHTANLMSLARLFRINAVGVMLVLIAQTCNRCCLRCLSYAHPVFNLYLEFRAGYDFFPQNFTYACCKLAASS